MLEGEFGFLKVFCTKWDEAELTRGLCEEFVVSSMALKRYPSHATAHAAVRAVRDRQAEHGFKGAEVRRSLSPAPGAGSSTTTSRSPPT